MKCYNGNSVHLWIISVCVKKYQQYLQGIFDAVDKGLSEGNQIGKRILLPSSHTGSRRYVMQNYHDGIAICRVYGSPDLL